MAVRFLVALAPVRDLLLSAKHLFVAARDGEGPSPYRSQRQPHQNHATNAASQMATATPRTMTSNR